MDRSPLNQLPAELLNHIFELAFQWQDPVVLKYNTSTYPPSSRDNKIKNPRSLIQTCKTIRAEFSELFYATNTFIFLVHFPEHFVPATKTFFNEIGEDNSAALRNVIVRFPHRIYRRLGKFTLDVIDKTVRVRRLFKTKPSCALHIETTIAVPSLDLRLDLQDLKSPWDDLLEAVRKPYGVHWETMAPDHLDKMVVDMLMYWRAELSMA